MDKKEIIIAHIKNRLSSLESLGKLYSKEKIETLATKLVSTNKSIDEIKSLIDNKFAIEARKISHNNNLVSLREYYIASIDKLKKDNNVYLLSYENGLKAIEQANIKEVKSVTPFLKEVIINGDTRGFKKDNYSNNDYELISSDIAYYLNIPYSNTYRVFDESLDPIGVLHEFDESDDERILNMEEVLQFIKEESPKFNLKTDLIEFHDVNIKSGLRRIDKKSDYKDNLEYVMNLFKALPDITKDNLNKLRKDYINMKVFELLTNSLDNNLNNVAIIINKKEKKYTYKLFPSYNKCVTELNSIKDNEIICNFFIVDKNDLLSTIIDNYYSEAKEILSLITNNKDLLKEIIKNVLCEHLDFDSYNRYLNVIYENIDMLVNGTVNKKNVTVDSDEDKEVFRNNDILFNNRITPSLDNYKLEDISNEKGSVALVIVVALVLIITVLLIGAVLYAVSKMDM